MTIATLFSGLALLAVLVVIVCIVYELIKLQRQHKKRMKAYEVQSAFNEEFVRRVNKFTDEMDARLREVRDIDVSTLSEAEVSEVVLYGKELFECGSKLCRVVAKGNVMFKQDLTIIPVLPPKPAWLAIRTK